MLILLDVIQDLCRQIDFPSLRHARMLILLDVIQDLCRQIDFLSLRHARSQGPGPGPAALKLGGRGPHHDKGIRGGDSGGRLHGEIWVCCAETVAKPLAGTLFGAATREQKR